MGGTTASAGVRVAADGGGNDGAGLVATTGLGRSATGGVEVERLGGNTGRRTGAARLVCVFGGAASGSADWAMKRTAAWAAVLPVVDGRVPLSSGTTRQRSSSAAYGR